MMMISSCASILLIAAAARLLSPVNASPAASSRQEGAFPQERSFHDVNSLHRAAGEGLSFEPPFLRTPATTTATARSLQVDLIGGSCENPFPIEFDESNEQRIIEISNELDYSPTLPSSTVIYANERAVLWFELQGDGQHDLEIYGCTINGNQVGGSNYEKDLQRGDICADLFHPVDDILSTDLTVCPSQSPTLEYVVHPRQGQRYVYSVSYGYGFSPIDKYALYFARIPAKSTDTPPDGKSCGSAIPLEFGNDGKVSVLLSDGTIDPSSLPSATFLDSTSRRSMWVSFQGNNNVIRIQGCPDTRDQGWNLLKHIYTAESCSNLAHLPPNIVFDNTYFECPASSPLKAGTQETNIFHAQEGETYYLNVESSLSTDPIGNLIIFFETVPRPPNDSPESATSLELIDGAVEVVGDLTGATNSFVECTENHEQAIWYTLEGTGKRMLASTCSPDTTVRSLLYLRPLLPSNETAPECLVSSTAVYSCNVNDFAARLVFDTEQGVVYQISVVGVHIGLNHEQSTVRLSINELDDTSPPLNDDCSSAADIEFVDGVFVTMGTTQGATPGFEDSSQEESVFYQMAGTGDLITVSTCSQRTTFPTNIFIFKGGSCAEVMPSSQNLASFYTVCGTSSDQQFFQSLLGEDYLIMISTKEVLVTGQFELVVTSLNRPSNNDCEDASNIDIVDGIAELSVTLVGATRRTMQTQEIDASVWYTLLGTGEAFVATSCDASNFYSPRVVVHTGECQNLTRHEYSSEYMACDDGSWALANIFYTALGEVYQVEIILGIEQIFIDGGQFQVKVEAIPPSNEGVCKADIERPSLNGVACEGGDYCNKEFGILDVVSECKDECIHSDSSLTTFARKTTKFTYKSQSHKDTQVTYSFVDNNRPSEISFKEFREDGGDRCTVTVDGTSCNSCSMGVCGRFAMDCSNVVPDSSNVDLCDESTIDGLPDDNIFRFFYTESCMDDFQVANPTCDKALLIADQSIEITRFGSVSCDANDSHRWYRYVGKGTPAMASTCSQSTATPFFEAMLSIHSKCGATDFVVRNHGILDAVGSTGSCAKHSVVSSVHWFAEAGVEYLIDMSGTSEGECGRYLLTVGELLIPPQHARPCILTMAMGSKNGLTCSCDEGASFSETICHTSCPEVCNVQGTTCGQERFGSVSTKSGELLYDYTEFHYTQGEIQFAGYRVYGDPDCDIYFSTGGSDYLYCSACTMQDCGDGTTAPVADCSDLVEGRLTVDFCQRGQAFESGPFVAFSSSIAFEECAITESLTDQASEQPSQRISSKPSNSITPLPTVTSIVNKAGIPSQSPIETSTLGDISGTIGPNPYQHLLGLVLPFSYWLSI